MTFLELKVSKADKVAKYFNITQNEHKIITNFLNEKKGILILESPDENDTEKLAQAIMQELGDIEFIELKTLQDYLEFDKNHKKENSQPIGLYFTRQFSFPLYKYKWKKLEYYYKFPIIIDTKWNADFIFNSLEFQSLHFFGRPAQKEKYFSFKYGKATNIKNFDFDFETLYDVFYNFFLFKSILNHPLPPIYYHYKIPIYKDLNSKINNKVSYLQIGKKIKSYGQLHDYIREILKTAYFVNIYT